MADRDREKRPDITTVTAGAELKRWYWLKDELAAEAKRRSLRYSGGKFAILDRIAHFLDTGETSLLSDNKPKPTSTFDWHSAKLTPDTVITDSYRNSQNVRRFFKSHTKAHKEKPMSGFGAEQMFTPKALLARATSPGRARPPPGRAHRNGASRGKIGSYGSIKCRFQGLGAPTRGRARPLALSSAPYDPGFGALGSKIFTDRPGLDPGPR